MTKDRSSSPVKFRWTAGHELIGIPILADAVLDRIIHNAYRIDMAGESLRKRRMST
jgi:DNA replication protein DnaC